MFDSRFYKKNNPTSIAKIISLCNDFGLKVEGEGSFEIKDLSPLDTATQSNISFLDNKKYAPKLKESKAGAVFLRKEFASYLPKQAIGLFTPNPYFAFALLADYFYKPIYSVNKKLISKKAAIGSGSYIAPSVYIADNVEIGKNCVIHPHTYIGQGVKIGDNNIIHSNCSIQFAIIGSDNIFHSGVKIGTDGFGFANVLDKNFKVPQLGRVIIKNKVEIGSNTCIDRGSFQDTIINDGVKIDNLVHIAHNVVIGKNSLIAAQVGISGSVKIGENVVIAGQVGFVGHISIGNFSQIGAQAGITKDLPPKSKVTGTPAEPIIEHYRNLVKLRNLNKKD